MSGKITLAGTVPLEELNGLGSDKAIKEFLDEPNKTVLVVGLVTNYVTKVNNERGTSTPCLRIRQWEIVLEEDAADVAGALARALAARTGAAELPFEPGQVLTFPDHGEPDAEEDAV